MGVQVEEKTLKHLGIKTGDVLIERKPHSCVVKFVEAADIVGVSQSTVVKTNNRYLYGTDTKPKQLV